jgi:hypothetical protein
LSPWGEPFFKKKEWKWKLQPVRQKRLKQWH